MSIAPLSVLGPYDLIDITDDALEPPAIPPEPERLTDETDEEWIARVAAHVDAAAKVGVEWRAAFDRATETGAWDGLLIVGKEPTRFHIRQVGVTAWAAFKRAARTMGADGTDTLGADELQIAAFRLAVSGITGHNLGIAIKREPYTGDDGRRERAFGDVLATSVIDAIAQAPGGKFVIARIGAAVLKQRGAPLGKA